MLDTSLHELRRFSASVQRHLDPLLVKIKEAAEVCLLDTNDLSPQGQELQRLLVLCSDARSLIARLSAFAGTQLLVARRLPLLSWLAQIEPLLASVLGPRTLLEIHPCDPTLALHCDAHLLEHVLLHLVRNAREAKCSRLTLRISELLLEQYHADFCLAPGRYACICLIDDGEGIPEALLGYASFPFVTTKRDALGLGLSEVHGILLSHKGNMVVKSTVADGTVISLYLPQARPPAESQDEATPTGERKTLLLVDDEPLVRRTVRRLLEGLGFAVLEAKSGAEAMACIQTAHAPIDLVISDVAMPDMNGIELYQTLSFHFPKLKHLFTSGCPADTLDGLPKHVDFLQKPFTNVELVRHVKRILGE